MRHRSPNVSGISSSPIGAGTSSPASASPTPPGGDSSGPGEPGRALNNWQRWTDADNITLRLLGPSNDSVTLGAMLGRTSDSILGHASKIGVSVNGGRISRLPPNPKREAATQLVLDGKMTLEDAGATAGVSRQRCYQWVAAARVAKRKKEEGAHVEKER